MAGPGLISPLQLTGGVGLLDNTVLQLNPDFSAAADTYMGLSFISDLASTIEGAAEAGISESNLNSLRTLGSSVCPALGDSVPSEFTNQEPFLEGGAPKGLIPLIQETGDGYVGSGDSGKFAQAFAAAQGYVSLVNQFILSAVNANEYLGPTFTNLDNMITRDFVKVSSDLPAFGADLLNLGLLISLPNLDELGEPAALLQQLSQVGNMGASTLPCVDVALRSVGLDTPDIINLITNNRQSLFNPRGLTENQFDRLQQRAYQGFTLVGGDCLEQVKAVLGVTVPLEDMADLLNPVKILPDSYFTLLYQDTPIYSPNGTLLIPSTGGTSFVPEPPPPVPVPPGPVPPGPVPPGPVPPVPPGAETTPRPISTPTGCDELGKIIPPDQAVANKALQFELQQVSGISNLTLPQLAALLA